MSLLQRFIEEDEPGTENARYILALMLERKRILSPTATKEVDLSATETARVVVDDQTAALARVRGRVDGRIDLATVVVRAFREDEPMPANYEGLLRGTPQADGAFEIDGLVAGRWRLQVMRGDDVLHWQVLAVEPAADVEVLLRVR